MLSVSYSQNLVLKLTQVILGAIGIFLAAQINIPIKPVAITLHTTFVILISLKYSGNLAFYSVLIYIGAGLIGLPVFSKYSSGIDYFAGPVLGYYIGMLITSYILPLVSIKWRGNKNDILKLSVLIVLGMLLIYIPGIIWLAKFLGFENAIYNGLLVFIVPEIIKFFVLLFLLKII